jgi:hypothetical protein
MRSTRSCSTGGAPPPERLAARASPLAAPLDDRPDARHARAAPAEHALHEVAPPARAGQLLEPGQFSQQLAVDADRGDVGPAALVRGPRDRLDELAVGSQLGVIVTSYVGSGSPLPAPWAAVAIATTSAASDSSRRRRRCGQLTGGGSFRLSGYFMRSTVRTRMGSPNRGRGRTQSRLKGSIGLIVDPPRGC